MNCLPTFAYFHDIWSICCKCSYFFHYSSLNICKNKIFVYIYSIRGVSAVGLPPRFKSFEAIQNFWKHKTVRKFALDLLCSCSLLIFFLRVCKFKSVWFFYHQIKEPKKQMFWNIFLQEELDIYLFWNLIRKIVYLMFLQL